MNIRIRWILLFGLCSTSCAGPERGFVAEFRGRTQVRRDIQGAVEAERTAGDGASSTPLFPLLFAEGGKNGRSFEFLWPFFETGRGPELEEGAAHYFRLRPLLYADSFHRHWRLVVFPFYFHIREELEAGNRSIDHLWPIYGFHREWIDLAPAVTHHFLFPLIYFRNGWNRWKISVFPVLAGSNGYLDRGWWLLPIVKWGAHGHSRFFYLLDPLVAYEHDSIAEEAEDETPEDARTSLKILGGFLGWENMRGEKRVRLFWFLHF